MAVTLEVPKNLSDEHEPDQPDLKIADELAETEEPETETADPDEETEGDEDDPDEDDEADPDDTDVYVGQAKAEPAANADTLAELREVEQQCGELELRIASIKEDLKEHKKEYDAACIRLRRLVRTLTEDLPLFDRPQAAEATTAEEVDPISDDTDSWRAVPIEELRLDQVKSFGAKKREALYALCPTIGALEDLRAEASSQHKQFADVLPDGFGQKITDEIENAVIEWMAKRNS